MGDLSHFERGQLIGVRLAGAYVTKTATLLGASRATVSKVMSAYTNHGKTAVKKNGGQKSTLTERYCHPLRTVSKNHIITAAQVTAELNMYSS
jgi:predicted transcriptional regulator